jgi:hypothetical protein
MITSEFNFKIGILEVVYSGNIILPDLIEFGDKIFSDQSLPRQLLILTDVTNATYHLSNEDFETVLKNIKKHLSAFEYIKGAFIQAKPRETAYSMLLSEKNPVKNYMRGVFSTRDAAEKWLLSG